MRILKRYLVTTSVIFFFGGVSCLYAQKDQTPLMKKDTTEQDKTRIVKEKSIKNTSQRKTNKDTSIHNKKTIGSEKADSVYLLPEKHTQSK